MGGPRESLGPGFKFGLARDAVRGRFFQQLSAPSRSRRMLSHARSPPPPPCAFRRSSRAWRQWIILLHRDDTPVLVGTARLVAFPDHVAYRRQTPSGQMVRRRDQTGGSDEQRAASGHRRCLADPLGQTWLSSIYQAPHATPELSRWCRARRPTRHFEQIPSKSIPTSIANRYSSVWGGVGNRPIPLYQPKIPCPNNSRTEITVTLRALRQRPRSPESEETLFTVVIWRE